MRVRHERRVTPLPHERTSEEPASARLRRGLAEAGLDCACQDKANAVLNDFDHEQELQRRASALAEARSMRDAVVMALALLGEVDELTPDEPDVTAFGELAGLFEDVAEFASAGAEAMRHVASPTISIPKVRAGAT